MRIHFYFLEIRVGFERRALLLVLVVHYHSVAIRHVDVPIAVYGHAPQFLDDEIEVDVDSDDAKKIALDEERCHIRNYIGL